MSPEEFINGLCNVKKTFGKKMFGSVHGFYGVTCKDIVEKNGGKFFAVFRHPILKINSIFSAYYASIVSQYKIKADDTKIDYFKIFSRLSYNIDNIYENKIKFKKKKELFNKILKSFFL